MESVSKCPFCGGNGRAVRTKDMSGYWYCECEKCYARQLAYSKDQAEAIKAWNKRHDPDTTLPAPEPRTSHEPYVEVGSHNTAQGE